MVCRKGCVYIPLGTDLKKVLFWCRNSVILSALLKIKSYPAPLNDSGCFIYLFFSYSLCEDVLLCLRAGDSRGQKALCFRVVRTSVCPIFGNTISQERLEGMYSHLAQMSTETQGFTNYISVVKGQGHCDLTKCVFGLNLRIPTVIITLHTNV